MQASRRGAWRCARGLRTERVYLLWRPHPMSPFRVGSLPQDDNAGLALGAHGGAPAG